MGAAAVAHRGHWPTAPGHVVWWLTAAAMALGLTGIAIAVGAPTRDAPTLSSYDEQAHYDYVVDVTHGHLPVFGDLYTQETARVISCLGVSGAERSGCGVRHRDPRFFPPDGYSYEAQQPPLGYLPFLLVANANAAPHQAVAAARWGGTLWTAIAAGLLVGVGAVEGLSLLELLVVLTICLLSPLATYFQAIVSNDAAAVAAGSLALLWVSLARRRERPMVVGAFVVGAALGLMKGVFPFAPLVLLVASVVEGGRGGLRVGRAELWRRHACAASVLVGGAASYLAWIVVQDLRATVSPAKVLHVLQAGVVTPVPQWSTFEMSIRELLSPMLPPLTTTSLAFVWDVVVVGTVLGVIFLRERSGEQPSVRASAIAVLAGMGMMTVVVEVVEFVQGHYNLFVTSRFGLPLLPIVALVVVRAWRRNAQLVAGVALPVAVVLSELLPGHI